MTDPTHSTYPRRRAVTLVEMLVALMVATLLFSSVISAFLVLIQMSEDNDIEFEALQGARAAIEMLSNEIKALDHNLPMVFIGIDTPLPSTTGDGIDNDGDGTIDEEVPDGLDDDGDWSDLHAQAGPSFERRNRQGWPDLGDIGVDEDEQFHTDTLAYRVYATIPGYDYDLVTYSIATFEGRPYTLVKSVSRWAGGSEIAFSTSPVAYNVLSFNCLYWDPNAIAPAQHYVTNWSHTGPFGPPGFELPAAVAITIVAYADRKPIEDYTPGDPVRTLTLRTVVAIESVIQDAAYPRDF